MKLDKNHGITTLALSDIPNIVNGSIVYFIMNGICFVYVADVYLSTTESVGITALPEYKNGWYIDIRLGNGKSTVGEIASAYGNSQLMILHHFDLGFGMWGQFCYPIE